ncbi:MAG TPA: branched-chain amino acid ABC transporter permease [Burkholderiales bacterium]|nr:branched-chain amino acid ABC transporter permease [Burkholderiales bacterium]
MGIPLDLLLEAVLFGILLGGFYAAVSMGLSVSFGLLDVPNVAHPAIMVFGSYCTYLVVGRLGIDPILAGVLLTPAFFILGMAVYRFYYETFEKRGRREAGVRGIAFFFGLALIIEVGLILGFGVDQRMVDAPYIGRSMTFFSDIRVPLRMLVAFGVALVLTIGLTLYMSRTFTGRAIKAVAQDEVALRLMGANPVRIKQWAFGIATAASVIAGSMLIIVGPVEPGMDRVYIGRTFAVVVLAGLGSMTGTVFAGLILGISESIVLMHPGLGASWAPAVSFLLLLLMLGVRPQGLFGR